MTRQQKCDKWGALNVCAYFGDTKNTFGNASPSSNQEWVSLMNWFVNTIFIPLHHYGLGRANFIKMRRKTCSLITNPFSNLTGGWIIARCAYFTGLQGMQIRTEHTAPEVCILEKIYQQFFLWLVSREGQKLQVLAEPGAEGSVDNFVNLDLLSPPASFTSEKCKCWQNLAKEV